MFQPKKTSPATSVGSDKGSASARATPRRGLATLLTNTAGLGAADALTQHFASPGAPAEEESTDCVMVTTPPPSSDKRSARSPRSKQEQKREGASDTPIVLDTTTPEDQSQGEDESAEPDSKRASPDEDDAMETA